jgi:hypothetical protein
LVAAALLGSAFVWYATLSPLESPYGVSSGRDRLHNLANSQVAAAGHSPRQTFQLDQAQPAGRPHWVFWSLFVALASGFQPDRVFAVYDLTGLVAALLWVVAVYVGLRPTRACSDFTAWEAAMAAAFAALLSSQPLDFLGPYRTPWPMNFLLKPNHALALALTPLFFRGFVQLRGWSGRAFAALGLNLLGWVFLLYMAYVTLGLIVFAALGWCLVTERRRRDTGDVAVVLALNLCVGLPFLGPLIQGNPFLEPSLESVPVFSPHGLDVTVGSGWLFWGACLGSLVAIRRGRLGQLLTAQFGAGLAVSALYWPAQWLERVRSADEIFYWLRFQMAILAAIGALAVCRFAIVQLWPRVRATEPLVAGTLCLTVLPLTLPIWWQPRLMDQYHVAALEPLPEALDSMGRWLRANTSRDAVVATDTAFAIHAAALGATRVFLSDTNAPPDRERRRQILDALTGGESPQAVTVARAAGVTHLIVTPSMRDEKGSFRTRRDLRLVFSTPDGTIEVYELMVHAP